MRAVVALLPLLAAVSAQLPSDYQDANWGTKACDSLTDTGCCCARNKRNNDAATCTDVEQLLCYTKTQSSAAQASVDTAFAAVQADGNQIWIILCGALVFFMQCGFAMLEAGSVRTRNTQNIIFKNMLDACIGAISFFAVGYAFAYGDGSKAGGDAGRFIGANNFFLTKENNDESGQHMFFFQFAFAGTAATIVSGAVAERTKVIAYFLYSIVLTAFIYPVVVHWVWSSHGWLSAFATPEERMGPNGMIDYAGSGVVHAVGGWAGLCGTLVLGPRTDRFERVESDAPRYQWWKHYGAAKPIHGQSPMLAALGVMILWFGWYGFNCGSTLAFDGENAGKVAVTTTLAAAAGGMTVCFATRLIEGFWNVEGGLNGVLAGLVSITAGCSVVDEWCALLIGMIGGAVYFGAAELLVKLKIDDPLNAWPVHGACGVWGCLAVGIFAQGRNIARAYSADLDLHAPTRGAQFAIQLGGICAIVAWTVALCLVTFFAIDFTIGMRITEEEEDKGLDAVDHGQPTTRTFDLRAAAKRQANDPFEE